MRKVLKAIRQLLLQPGERSRITLYWFIVLSLLLFIPNIALLIEITFNQPLLTFGQRLMFIYDIYANTIRYLLKPITLSLVLLSAVLAINFAMIRFIRRKNQSASGKLNSTVAMLVSSHCLACGGSLISPLVGLIGGTGAYIGSGYTKMQTITVILNIIAIVIVVRSIYKVSPVLIRVTSLPKQNFT